MAASGEGVLAFEQPGGGSDVINASRVAQILAEGKVPVVVLNACQSGAVGKELEASVATALLGPAARQWLRWPTACTRSRRRSSWPRSTSPFAGNSVGQAVAVGRKRMFEHDLRPSMQGEMPLADWLVPVHYLRREVRFPRRPYCPPGHRAIP